MKDLWKNSPATRLWLCYAAFLACFAILFPAFVHLHFPIIPAPGTDGYAVHSWFMILFWLLFALGLVGGVVWLQRARRRVADMVAFCRKADAATPTGKALAVRRRDDLGALEQGLNGLARAFTGRLEDMKAERERLQSILSCMMEGVIVLDTKGKVILVNQTAQGIFKLPADDSVLGMSTVEVSRHPEMQSLIQDVLNSDTDSDSVHRELSLGDDRWFAANAVRLEHSRQGLLGYVLVFHEVSELKRLERIRADFVANVSHEMRTPLTAIQGYAETLLHNPPDDPRMALQFLNIVTRHSERLGRLIDDLLALSDLEMGNANVRMQEVAVQPLLDRVLELFRDQAQKKHIRLNAHVGADTQNILGDEDRLQQLLINLVDNALKYTSADGSVQVQAQPAADGAHPPRVVLNVSDTGCGIPDKDLPRLTERFYRVDKARSRELGGTGLGLAIVKHIAQAHDGELQIESRLGKGTRVSVYLLAAHGRLAVPVRAPSVKPVVA
ncbi:MAG: ATP-binding protein [Deltaproteobacteria bacterium]|nr:ATP-binding protein [Deltaproteobacteria bacterium]